MTIRTRSCPFLRRSRDRTPDSAAGPPARARAALGAARGFFLIKKRELLMAPLAAALQTAMEKIEVCKICGNIDTQNPCTVCTDARRDGAAIVVVADVADLWALERAHAINARYHVLGGTLSPLDGVGPRRPHHRCVGQARPRAGGAGDLLALNATVDGQSTAHYITDLLHGANVKVTRLAHGVPVGASSTISTKGRWRRPCGAGRRFKGQAAGLPAG